MFKSLKSKISLIYLFLVCTIAVVGISSVINFYKLTKSINGLMVDNYKSISASNKMVEALEDQNRYEQEYIYTGNQSSIDNYIQSSNSFYKWYNIEANNLTEVGEKGLVDKINEYYLNYESEFSKLQNIRNNSGEAAATQYYKTNMLPSFNALRAEINKVTTLNEDAMFSGKDRVMISARDAMYIIGTLSITVILVGFALSTALTNKFLEPLFVLKENIKAVKAGNLKQQASIQSDDEIGELADEFNKMTSRLIEFEKSTKGMLIEERNKSIAIIKSISDPVIVLDTYYRVILLNHASEVFFKINEDDALNKHFLEVMKNSEVYDHIVEAFASVEEKYRPKIISIHADDKEFFFDTIVTKVRDEASNIKGVVVLFQNVTKLKKLEKAKTEFLSTISHEFKTPLTSIMMGVSLIKNDMLGSLNEKQQDIIDTIEDDSEKLTSLVNDVLQLSKIESDSALFDFHPCSVYGIVDNCIKGFIDIAENKEINLSSDISEKLPKIMADYEKLSWAINNLISNALKFTNAGDYITISAKPSGTLMYISVTDTGIGIPEEYKDKIFEKFEKVGTGDNAPNGTGLGLSISKRIIEIHKGQIWCESKLDEGSTFTFTVPLADK